MDSSEPSIPDLTRQMYDHLDATAELPIDPTANRWLGEAEAAAADVADGTASEAVIAKRAGQVEHLLESAGETGHPEAETHVEAALSAARELVDRLEEPSN